MKAKRFEELEVWQEARELCKQIFVITNAEPFAKDFKFRNQIKSSSGSVMDNIAEGFERGGNKEFIQFLSIAKGSCGEVRSQIYRAYDFKYIDRETMENISGHAVVLSKKLSSFIKYLRQSAYKGPKYK